MLSRNLRFWRAVWLLTVLFFTGAAFASQAQNSDVNGNLNANVSAGANAKPNAKPAFSLWCWQSYGTSERAKFSVNYYNLDKLDFRVYRINNPQEFFRRLNNPHQLGEADESITRTYAKREVSFLERVRNFKQSIYFPIRNFLRGQLQRKTRATLRPQLSGDRDEADVKARLPLNVADFARVPLLNPNQLVSSWREELKPLESEYDRRVISLGHREPGVYLVEAVHGDLRAFTVVIVSDLTLIQKLASDKEMTVLAVDRKTGAPREGVTIEVSERRELLARGVTGSEGLLRTQVKRATERSARDGSYASYDYLIMGSDKRDFIVSDLQHYSLGLYSDDESNRDRLTGYIYTDRPVYRPNQKIYFKGILRRTSDDGGGGYTNTANTAHVTVSDQNGETIYESDLPLSARGTFNGECETTEDAPLGGYSIAVSTVDGNVSGYFEVQEYKKPEYKVSVAANDKFAPIGKQTRFTIEARYFFGAPVTRADVKYYIYRSRYYHFRGADETDAETYGDDESHQEIFEGEYGFDGEDGYGGYGDDLVQEGAGTLNRDGKLEVAFTIPKPDEKQPFDFTYRLEAEVTDAARRTNQGKASVTGTRGTLVADTTTDRYVYQRGDTARLKVRAADYENRPQRAKVKLQFVETLYEARESETKARVEYVTRDKLLSTAEVQTNEQGEALYDYIVPRAGSITIKTVLSEGGRDYVSTVDAIYATDDDNDWDEDAIAGEGSIKIVFDKKVYQPGETARVLAILPKDGTSHLLVTTELDTLMTARHITARNRAVAFEIPIERRYTPNVFLSVAMVRDGELYTQDRTLVVPARDKALSVEVIPDKQEYRPREVASYTVAVRNHDGTPTPNAEISLGVVDEAVYEIRGESAGDMRTTFYGRRYNSVSTAFAANYSFTGYSGKEALELARRTKHKPPINSFADVKNDNQYAQPVIRKIFKDTALWQPSALTDANGRANIRVELPDNLTTWRATARAVTNDLRVGAGINKTLARKDVIVRLAMPRFLTEGDTVTVSGIVHNYLKQAKQTKITLQASGAELNGQAANQIVQLEPNGDHRLDFQLYAPRTGNITLLAKALTDTESDAVELPLEVIPRGIERGRGGALTLFDENATREVTLELPANANADSARLSLEAAPSLASSLFGALDYLTTYPYGCTEQTLSSFVPNIVVARTLQNVENTFVKDTARLNANVARGLKRIYAYQNADGGWSWFGDERSNPFMTAYAVDALTMAREAGYSIEDGRLSQAGEALMKILNDNKADDGKPLDAETRAYATYALAKVNRSSGFINELYNRRHELQPYGKALLTLALIEVGDELRARETLVELERTARVNDYEAHWEATRSTRGEDTEINDVETTSLAIKAFARLNPQSPLFPKAALWLVNNRANGSYWMTTKQSAFAIYALVDYLKISKEETPDYELEIYLDDKQVFDARITAESVRSGASFKLERRASEVKPTSRIRIVKRGAGAVYFNTRLKFFTREENTEAASTPDLNLAREYLRLKIADKDGTPFWATEPLSGDMRSGDLIVSRLRVKGARGRYLLIEDPIPAGCEQITQSSGLNFDRDEKTWTDFYSAREFRDNRTAFFINFFDGDATFNYVLRVQAPGAFRVAAARVELMYQPTVNANTATSSLTIHDR